MPQPIRILATLKDLEDLGRELTQWRENEELPHAVGSTLSVALETGITGSPQVVNFEIRCDECFGRGWVPEGVDDSQPCPAGCEEPK